MSVTFFGNTSIDTGLRCLTTINTAKALYLKPLINNVTARNKLQPLLFPLPFRLPLTFYFHTLITE